MLTIETVEGSALELNAELRITANIEDSQLTALEAKLMGTAGFSIGRPRGSVCGRDILGRGAIDRGWLSAVHWLGRSSSTCHPYHLCHMAIEFFAAR